MKIIMNERRTSTIIISFIVVVLLILLKAIYYGGISKVNIFGSIFIYIFSVYIIFNGSYLFVRKINLNSSDYDYYARFLMLIITYFMLIFCIFN
ncbi:hypothetical protein AAV97_03930 [Acinetobacter sp. Ag2]|nr:hypothetical protein AAV97_03930 [Acinetobacter sp. Ag2]